MIFILPFYLSALFCLQCMALQSFDDFGHERIQLSDVSIHFRYSASGKPPLLLVHGSPQHSRTWTYIAPLLAENYTVIAPDNRGTGDSGLSSSDNYTAAAGAEDLRAILDFLNISKTYVFAHDKGVGLAASLALEHPERIEKMVLAEYPLPGYGYPTNVTSTSLYQNWQLAFFAVPDAAVYFLTGKEREMLAWYFWHGSYSGDDVISNDLLDTYTRSISKPGFLRAQMQYFAAAFADAGYFQNRFAALGKLQMPIMTLGGEASFAPASAQVQTFTPLVANLTTAVIPKAGHWIGDENPGGSASRVLQFYGDNTGVPSVDLSWLEDTITLFGDFGIDATTTGTNRSGPPF